MEKNEISKKLKKKLNEAGLTHLKVKGGKGTAYGWIDVWGKDYESFTESDQAKLFEIGITSNPICLTNCLCHECKVWEAIVNKPKYDSKLEELKDLFYKTATTKNDFGTCCGGSGVFIYKDGLKIDFWKNNFAQSSDPLHEAVRELGYHFEVHGYKMVVEDGWMD